MNKDREWQKRGKLVRYIVEELTKECPTLDEAKEVLKDADAVTSTLLENNQRTGRDNEQ